MKSIYIPSESFNTRDEVSIINKLLVSLSESMLDRIDDRVEVWIIGNKDTGFFNRLINVPISEER